MIAPRFSDIFISSWVIGSLASTVQCLLSNTGSEGVGIWPSRESLDPSEKLVTFKYLTFYEFTVFTAWFVWPVRNDHHIWNRYPITTFMNKIAC